MKTTGRVLSVVLAGALVLVGTGCGERNPTELEVSRAPQDPVVFDDAYSPDVYFQPFFNTHYTAASLDSVFTHGGSAFEGARSLKFAVPPQGSSLGLYTGGVLTSSGKRDLADFNALTFYARTDDPITLDTVGFGNDNTGTSLYEAGRGGIAIGPEWTFVVVPIPAPSRLFAERGLFTIAESCDPLYPRGYDVWIDDIRYAKLTNIVPFRIQMSTTPQFAFVGNEVNIGGTSTIFQMDGGFVPVTHSSHYFDYESTDPAVVSSRLGVVRAVGPGTATIAANLEGFEFTDPRLQPKMAVTVHEPPTTAAATPTLPAGDVVSLFSDAYADVLVDSWRADWQYSTAVLSDYVVAGNPTKMYANLNHVGILFESSPIDASQMTHFHLDVYAPAGTNFRVELVSFPGGAEPGVITQVLELTDTTTPAFLPGGWASLDIPLADFVAPAEFDWASLAQLVLSTTNASLVLVDNVYFHR